MNGKIEEITETTLMGLLQSKKIEPQMVSVELNAVMLNRADYPSTILTAGDEIEFLYFMGGGGAGESSDSGRPTIPDGDRVEICVKGLFS
jgi:sulfur carrier protein